MVPGAVYLREASGIPSEYSNGSYLNCSFRNCSHGLFNDENVKIIITHIMYK